MTSSVISGSFVNVNSAFVYAIQAVQFTFQESVQKWLVTGPKDFRLLTDDHVIRLLNEALGLGYRITALSGQRALVFN